MFDDGCTALSWHDDNSALLAQNWDWRPAQQPNLIHLTILQPGQSIEMITEAGIIGKIGLNSAGIGVCLNAIRVKGVSYEKLPVHLALRKALEYSGDLNELAGHFKAGGVASSAHILIACEQGAIGLETTSETVVLLKERATGAGNVLTHTNHLLIKHGAINEQLELLDSPARLKRIDGFLDSRRSHPSADTIANMLKDEQGYPTSICRAATKESKAGTCFSIVMDLRARKARVKLGRPCDDGEEVELDASLNM